MTSVEEAKELATLMKKIGDNYGKKTICVLSNMNEPLGITIGNALEIKECIDFFEGFYREDLNELVRVLSANMIMLGKNITFKEAMDEVNKVIEDGTAYSKFKKFIRSQNGNLDNLKISERKQAILSLKEGYIKEIDSHKLGILVKDLGGGRMNKEDEIDYTVGFALDKKVGDHVNLNEKLLTVYFNKKDISIKEILECFTIAEIMTEKSKIIIDIV